MDHTNRRAFIFAGKARFTITSKATGTRFTYMVRKRDNVWFVSVLTGPEHYTYLGLVNAEGHFCPDRKERIGKDAPSRVAFNWFFPRIDRPLPNMEFHHEGHCGRCGRALTVPSSIESGIGPECAKRI